jgi:RNA polymerase sigma-70 factor (ECF subfamily)
MSSTESLASIYREHHGWLVQMLRRRLSGNIEHAADLAHDTFERVLRHAPSSLLDEPRGFLTTIAKRLLIDQARRKEIEQAYLDTLALRDDDMAPSPETMALVLETLNAVCKVLEQLPPRARRVFILAQIEGTPYRDIAYELRISVAAVQRDMVKAWEHCYTALYA